MNFFKSPTILRETALVFLMVLVAYGYFSTERDVNINSRLALVRAIVDEGRLEIDSYHDAELYTNDKAFFNGHYYSDKAIGASALGVAAYYQVRWVYYRLDLNLTPRAFREWVTFLAVSLPAALLAPFLYVLIRLLERERRTALLVTLGICLGTPIFKYGTAFYGHTLAAVSFFLAFLIWVRIRQRAGTPLFSVFLSGFLMGFTFITEYPTAILLFTLSIYIFITLYGLQQHWNWKVYAALFLGFGIPVLLLALYNLKVYGSPLTVGYLHEADSTFREAHATSFMGINLPNVLVMYYMTLHPMLGIFWQSPVLLLGLAGWVFMASRREARLEWTFSLVSVFLFISVISGYYMWWGGVAFTPRHLVPILPLFAIPLAYLPERLSPLVLASVAVSFFQNLLITASAETGLVEFLNGAIKGNIIPVDPGSVIYQICLPNVLGGAMVNNRALQFLGFEGPMGMVPLLLMEVLLVVLFSRTKAPA